MVPAGTAYERTSPPSSVVATQPPSRLPVNAPVLDPAPYAPDGNRWGVEVSVRRGNLAVPVLLAAATASGVLLLYLGAGLTFFNDDWGVLLNRGGFTLDVFLLPNNEHLALVPVAIYKALQATLGMESALPYRVVATFVFLGSAGLLFVYLRRCVGDWLALLATIVVLFLGAAWEDLLWAFQVGFFGSVAAGLGMLLALQREDRTGDRLACGLLVVSIACSSLGLSFAAGAAVDIVLRRERWLRRSYVVVVPLLLFVLWYVGWGHEARSTLSLQNLDTTPRYVIESAGAGVSALLGLFAFEESVRRDLLVLVAATAVVAGAAVALWSLRRTGALQLPLRGPGFSRWFWVVATIPLAFWVLGGLNEIPERAPTASRYLYPDAVFILLLLGEWFRGSRVGARPVIVASIFVVVSVAGNLVALRDGYRFLERDSDFARAQLGALEIPRERVDPAYSPRGSGFVIGSQYLGAVRAGPYLSAVEDFGSPADDPAELRERPESVRFVADVVVAQALGVRLDSPVAGETVGGGPAPRRGSPERLEGEYGMCETFEHRGEGAGAARLPTGDVALRAEGGRPFEVRLRRFATNSFPIDLGEVRRGAWALVRIPPDEVSEPWELEADRAVTVCGPA
jgi:hypothetical protein